MTFNKFISKPKPPSGLSLLFYSSWRVGGWGGGVPSFFPFVLCISVLRCVNMKRRWKKSTTHSFPFLIFFYIYIDPTGKKKRDPFGGCEYTQSGLVSVSSPQQNACNTWIIKQKTMKNSSLLFQFYLTVPASHQTRPWLCPRVWLWHQSWVQS